MSVKKLFQTPIKGCYGVIIQSFKDDRGEFFEIYNEYEYPDLSLYHWCQDNVSISNKNVLRGFHFQKGGFVQNKLVSVLKGIGEDVVIDCREKSPTFGKSFKITLSSLNRKQLFIPAGCAHGFLSLTNDTVFLYKCDSPYNKESEGGIHPLDPKLNIWEGYDTKSLILSEKDRILPNWNNCYKFDIKNYL